MSSHLYYEDQDDVCKPSGVAQAWRNQLQNAENENLKQTRVSTSLGLDSEEDCLDSVMKPSGVAQAWRNQLQNAENKDDPVQVADVETATTTENIVSEDARSVDEPVEFSHTPM